MNPPIYMIVISCCLLLFASCQDSTENKGENIPSESMDSAAVNVAPPSSWLNQKPNYEDMSVVGDFNGDSKIDTGVLQVLTPNGKVIPTDSLSFLVPEAWEGVCNILFNDRSIPQLRINIQSIGLAFLENEGDLNNDGKDELSFIEEGHSDFIRSFSVVSLIDDKWKLVAESTVNIGYIYDNEPPYDSLIIPGDYINTLEIMQYETREDEHIWEKKTITFANEIQI